MRGLTTAEHLRNSVEHSGGFTWSPYSETPKTGYMVGLLNIVIKPNNDNPLTNGELKLAMDWLSSKPGSYFLGGWKDSSTGEVYYDISEHFTNIEDAYDAGFQRGELAIFDLSNMQEIPIDYDSYEGEVS